MQFSPIVFQKGNKDSFINFSNDWIPELQCLVKRRKTHLSKHIFKTL